MEKKKLLALLSIICLISILTMLPFMGACAKPAPTVTKIAFTVSLPPPPAPPAKAAASVQSLVDFSTRVEEATQGRVIIENYWGSSLGKADEFIKMVGSPGVADAGWMISGYHKWEVPLSAAVSLPFLTSNLEVQSRAVTELYETWDPFRDEWDKVNCKVIWATASPCYTLMTKDKPIQTLDDMRGMKLFGIGYYADCLNAAGAKVVTFPAPELYESLAKGVIEGMFGPHTGHYLFRVWELSNHLTNASFVGAIGHQYWAINKDVWSRISKDDQKAMEEVGAGILEDYLANEKAEVLRVNEAYIEKGMKFYEFSAADKAKWAEVAGVPIHNDWLAEMDKRGQGDEAREFLKRYRALLEKYEPQAKYEFIFPK